MNNTNAGWFVLYTRSRHEKKVMHELNAREIEGFLPTINVITLTSERRRSIESPLFPSYVFVRLANRDSYFRTLGIEGVLFYVRIGSKIASINEDVINKLRISTKEAAQCLEVTSEKIYPGENLIITVGPFAGMSGEVIRYKGREKLIVRIDLLQRSILIDLPIENVRVKPTHPARQFRQ